MRITPIEIQQQQFKSRLFGYDTAAVDQFLEIIAEELERVTLQNNELKEALARTKGHLELLQEREKSLQQTLVTAQNIVDDMKENARRDADIVIAEAHVEGERIIQAAKQQRIDLLNEVNELKRQKITFEIGLRALLENHMQLLNMDVVQLLEPDNQHLLEDFNSEEIETSINKGLEPK